MQIYSSSHILIEKILRKFFKVNIERKYYSSFFNYKSPKANNNQKILIYSGINGIYVTPIEILFYHLLKKNGFKVDFYIYDKNIPINEIITQDRYDNIGKDSFWNKNISNNE